MSNQSRSQVIAHVSARRNRCTAFECNAQLATQRDSGPTVAPQRVCHYGTRKPQTMGPPQKTPRSWAVGTAARLDTVCLFCPTPSSLAKGLNYDHHCPAD